MKRYLAYLGKDFYPMPAMGDCVGSYDTLKECYLAIDKKAFAEASQDYDGDYPHYWEYSWYAIYDTQTGEYVDAVNNDYKELQLKIKHHGAA